MRFLTRLQPRILDRNWILKATAIGLALLLWGVVRADDPARIVVRDIPIEVVVGDAGWVLAAPPAPARATVVFSGPFWELARLAVEKPRIVVPIEEVQDSVEMRPLRTGWVQLDGDLTRTHIEDIRPSGSVLLLFERLTTRLVPVAIRTTGELPQGAQLAGALRTDPPAIRVSGPAHRLPELDSIPLLPVDLSELRGPTAIRVEVDTTGLEGLLISPRSVDLALPVVAAPNPLDAGEPLTGPSVGRSNSRRTP
jgi:YbbR domain-containing protein